MSMPSRTTEGGTYRYGFNGKETDQETGIQDYGMRWYLPNIARFPSVDPLTQEYPWYTPYQFAGNMPIWAIDLDGAEPLIATDYKTIDDLKKKITLAYSTNIFGTNTVHMSNVHKGKTVTDELSSSEMGQAEMKKVKDAKFYEKIPVGLKHPITALHKSSLEKIERMSFKKKNKEGMAFGSISESLLSKTKKIRGTLENTYLHTAGQAFITILFGETVANIAGHAHEKDMASLMTGNFQPHEVSDAIDNYADLINNQWGQEFGKEIMKELNISSSTPWTPEITASVLNKLQSKISETMEVKFKSAYKKEDNFIKNLTKFINNNK